MQANGANAHRIVKGNGNAAFPSWSPDGRTIVFADRPSRRVDKGDLYVVRVDGTGLRRPTATAADESTPAWAPDGRTLVYPRGADLWRMKPDGSSPRLLLRNASSPSWSPAGTHLAFVRSNHAWIANADGTAAKRVATTAATAVAWSPDGQWLVTASDERADLTLVRTDGTKSHALTHEPGYYHTWPSWQRVPSSGR